MEIKRVRTEAGLRAQCWTLNSHLVCWNRLSVAESKAFVPKAWMFIVIVFLLSLFLCCCWSWWLSPPFSQSKRADRIDVICFTHSGACGAGPVTDYLDDRWIETAQYTCSWPPSVTSCKTLCCDVISAFFSCGIIVRLISTLRFLATSRSRVVWAALTGLPAYLQQCHLRARVVTGLPADL